MPRWQPEMRDEDFLGRRVVRSLASDGSSSQATPFEAASTCLAAMTSDGMTWLWGDVLAEGHVTLLTGASGVGKSFVALDMVAAVTRGERDARGETCGEPAEVLLLSPEAELVDVVRPRLHDLRAEMSRVHALRGIRRSPGNPDEDTYRAFQLDEDLRILEHEIAARKAAGSPLRLIVIDPFPVELFACRYGTAELVRTMHYLAEIAAWSHAAILLVADDSSRLGGAWAKLDQALRATAQSVWTIVDGPQSSDSRVFFPYPIHYDGPRDDEPEPERDRLLLPVKANLKHKSMGLSFRLDTGRVEWNTAPVDMTAEEYYSQEFDRNRSSSLLLDLEWSERARATDWLKRRLARGVVPLREIKYAAQEQDISFSTLRRAFCGLKGVARRIGSSRLWGWALPEHDVESGRLPAWLKADENDAGFDTQTEPGVERGMKTGTGTGYAATMDMKMGTGTGYAATMDMKMGTGIGYGATMDMKMGTGTGYGASPHFHVQSMPDEAEIGAAWTENEVSPLVAGNPLDAECGTRRSGIVGESVRVTAQIPDEVVELPDGSLTWRSNLERMIREEADEVAILAARETRLPFS